MITVGVIGYGYWGPNLARNFNIPGIARVTAIADPRRECLKRAAESHREAKLTTDGRELLRAVRVDVVVIATPLKTHYELAKAALKNGKHVFVEKPFTATVAEAQELIELAERKNLRILVDHTFLFTPAVAKIKELVENGLLGRLFYYDSVRVNLGLFQRDTNVLWDLAPHDLSIVDHLLAEPPEAMIATGETHLNGHTDVAFLTIYFPGRVVAHININWLSPVKVRTTLIGGEKRMLVWNDLEADEKIRIYDKRAQVKRGKGVYDALVSYRLGDMWAPHLQQSEALTLAARHFVECILANRTPLSDGYAGLRVVRLLEAAEESLRQRGKVVEFGKPGRRLRIA